MIRPRRNNYPRGQGCNKKITSKFFFEKVSVPKLSHSTYSLSLYMAPYLNTLTQLILQLYLSVLKYQTHSDFAKTQKFSAAK